MIYCMSADSCFSYPVSAHVMAPRYVTSPPSSNRRATLVTGSVYARRRRPCSMFVAQNTWPSVAVRSVQLQLVCGTVCQRQCSLLSHWTFFDATWKLNSSSVLTSDMLLKTGHWFLQLTPRLSNDFTAAWKPQSIILASCKPGCKPGFRQVRAGLRRAFDFFVENLVANMSTLMQQVHSKFVGSCAC